MTMMLYSFCRVESSFSFFLVAIFTPSPPRHEPRGINPFIPPAPVCEHQYFILLLCACPCVCARMCILRARHGLNAGFEYATYNDVEDLKRVVKRINRRGKIRSLFGRPRRAVAAIMMEALQVR